MEYLICKKKKKNKAHIWSDGDTLCTMWSTGGLKQMDRDGYPRFDTFDNPRGHEVCTMCRNVFEKKEAA